MLISCKRTPFEPEKPDVLQYVDRRVTYNQDADKVEFQNKSVYAQYELFDPDIPSTKKLFPKDEYVISNTRRGSVKAERIDEYKFVAHLKHVFVQNSQYHPKHVLQVKDIGFSVSNEYTTEGVTIEGSYDIEIKYNKIYFKIK